MERRPAHGFPEAVGGEDGAALPPADVGLDARVRVEVPLHVRLICT